MRNSDEKRLLFVEAPETKEQINVEPLLKLVQFGDNSLTDGADAFLMFIDEHIRFLTLRIKFIDDYNMHGDFNQLSNLCHTLYKMKDALTDLTIIENEIK